LPTLKQTQHKTIQCKSHIIDAVTSISPSSCLSGLSWVESCSESSAITPGRAGSLAWLSCVLVSSCVCIPTVNSALNHACVAVAAFAQSSCIAKITSQRCSHARCPQRAPQKLASRLHYRGRQGKLWPAPARRFSLVRLVQGRRENIAGPGRSAPGKACSSTARPVTSTTKVSRACFLLICVYMVRFSQAIEQRMGEKEEFRFRAGRQPTCTGRVENDPRPPHAPRRFLSGCSPVTK
jgi:hypothetical protein